MLSHKLDRGRLFLNQMLNMSCTDQKRTLENENPEPRASAIAAALHRPCLRHQTSLSLQGPAAGAKGTDVARWNMGMSHFSVDNLKRKIKVLRSLLLKSSSGGSPPHARMSATSGRGATGNGRARGGCQPAFLHATGSEILEAKSSEQNAYRKLISINYFKPPAYLNESKHCKSYLK